MLDQSLQNALVLEAIEHFRRMLSSFNCVGNSFDWMTTRVNLGIALALLGMRERGRTRWARLDEAEVVYKAALEERLREREPLAWDDTARNRLMDLALNLLADLLPSEHRWGDDDGDGDGWLFQYSSLLLKR